LIDKSWLAMRVVRSTRPVVIKRQAGTIDGEQDQMQNKQIAFR
jgi:hypothetical protein